MTVFNIMEKKPIAYISSIFLKSKNNSSANINEIKLSLFILSKLSPYKIFISSHELVENKNIIHSKEIINSIKDIPKVIYFNREEFQRFTGSSTANLRRNINSAIDGLMKKQIELPNPFDMDNDKSRETFTWLSGARYNDSNGDIEIHVNEMILPYLLVFSNYSLVELQFFLNVNNPYAIYIYLACKIHKSTNRYSKEIRLNIDDFKDYLGLSGKYKMITMFQERVLDISIDEINSKLDINIAYELHKTGKRFTDITLKFSQKKDTSKQLEQPKRQSQEIEHQAPDDPLNLNDQDIIIAAQLQSYGIQRNKALEYVKTYGADTCKIGIEKLLGEIQKGREIKNISGYLVSCIENAGNNSSSQEIKAAMNAAEELAQDRKAQQMERFNSFDTYINNNEQQILVLLARHESQEKLTDELEIDMLRCLKNVVAQYEDLESMSPYYLTLRFKGDILNYTKIKSLVEELEVATKEERIAKLKADLEVKKAELGEVSGKAKGLVEKEITMLKVAIADLV